MREFVYGTDAQYRALDQALSEGKNYRYANRRLPNTCMPDTACLWFGKVNGSYRMCIDKGIITNSGSDDFRRFLERGEATFADMRSMTAFLHSLQPLFPEEQNNSVTNDSLDEQTPETEGHGASAFFFFFSENRADNVIDKGKLNVIRAENGKKKTVWPEEIANPLKQKVFGQEAAIDALSEMVVINQMRTDKKLLVITFLGPTATGKSETAKSR